MTTFFNMVIQSRNGVESSQL